MKEYNEGDKKKRIQDMKRMSFGALEQLEQDDMLEEYDLFGIMSDHFPDMDMVYMDRELHLITRSGKIKLIDRELLQGRNFIYKSNYAKQFIGQYGKDVFNLLTLSELISVVTGKPINEEELGEER